MSEERETYAIEPRREAYLATDVVNERSLAITQQLERATPKQKKLLFCLENSLPFSMVWSNSIYTVKNEGGIALDGKIIAARIRKSKRYDYTVTEWNNERCTVIIHRHSERVGGWIDCEPVTYTREDAIQSGLWDRDNWKKYPRRHLFYRAISLAQVVFAGDVFDTPVYAVEELPQSALDAQYVIEMPTPKPPPLSDDDKHKINDIIVKYGPAVGAKIISEAQKSGRPLDEVVGDYEDAQAIIEEHGKEIILEAHGGEVPHTVEELRVVSENMEDK